MDPLVKKAKEFAEKAHKGQIRLNGKPFMLHPEAVAEQVIAPFLKAAAYLHDVVEDTNYTVGDLLKEGFPEEVCEIVGILTKGKDERYLDYILRVKENHRARQIKLADLAHNLSDLRKGSLRDKYELTEHLLRLYNTIDDMEDEWDRT